LGLRSWAPGSGAFDARVKISMAAKSISGSYVTGFVIGDAASGNMLVINLALAAGNPAQSSSMAAYTYASSTFTLRGSSQLWIGVIPTYLRITRGASNDISYYYSYDGLVWQLFATATFTLTVANIGYRVVTPNTSEYTMISDWLRTSV
jgi:hypothetical protein